MNNQAGVIVIGAGGHAKVCIELLRARGEHVAFCVGAADSPEQCLGVSVLKGNENLSRLRNEGYLKVFIAIGSNSLRVRLRNLVNQQGFQLINAISPNAVISPTVTLGSGVAIMAGVIINADVEIGDLCIINTGATIDHDCRIGTAVHIGPQCALAGNIVVGHESFLGVGCKVVPEVVIGANATIGAGGVVIRDIETGIIAVGIPAKAIEKKS